MAETFREFFARRNLMPFPTCGGEQLETVLQRMADTMADWMDLLALRVPEPADDDAFAERARHLWDTRPELRRALMPLITWKDTN